MKKIGCALLALTLLMACDQGKTKKLQQFIPGLYVKSIDQEFATGMDTLHITIQDAALGIYNIERRSVYQQVLDGRKFPPKYEVHRYLALLDENTGQLRGQQKGRLYSFSPGRHTLTTGGSEYRKVQ